MCRRPVERNKGSVILFILHCWTKKKNLFADLTLWHFSNSYSNNGIIMTSIFNSLCSKTKKKWYTIICLGGILIQWTSRYVSFICEVGPNSHRVVCLLLQTLWIQRFIGAAKTYFSMALETHSTHPFNHLALLTNS